MPILNYTTKVPAERTVAEIQALLARKGAERISVDYLDQAPEAVTFVVQVDGVKVPFRLPARFEGVAKVMAGGLGTRAARRRKAADKEFRERARRVAWRIVKDWVAAQLALIEAGQAEMAEVFLPYAATPDGVTFFNHLRADRGALRMLGSGSRSPAEGA